MTSWHVVQYRLIHGSLLKPQWSLNSLAIVSFVEHLVNSDSILNGEPGVHN